MRARRVGAKPQLETSQESAQHGHAEIGGEQMVEAVSTHRRHDQDERQRHREADNDGPEQPFARIERGTFPPIAEWQPLGPIEVARNTTLVFTDHLDGIPQRFYRVVQVE